MTDSEYAIRNEEYTNIHFVDTFCDGNSPDEVKGSRSLSESLPIPTKRYSAVNIRFCEKQDHALQVPRTTAQNAFRAKESSKHLAYCVSAVNDGQTSFI